MLTWINIPSLNMGIPQSHAGFFDSSQVVFRFAASMG